MKIFEKNLIHLIISSVTNPASGKKTNLFRITSIGIIGAMTIYTALIDGAGFDWYKGYLRFASDPFMSPRPTWIYLIIQPLARLENSFIGFSVLSCMFLIACVWLIDNPHPLITLSMPVFWTLFFGQIDSWIALGVVLGFWAVRHKKPYLLGLAILLLTSKPHIGLPLMVYYLWRGRNWRTLVIPALVGGLSVLLYGFWPIRFMRSIQESNLLNYTDQIINISLWPWALLIIPVIVIKWRKATYHAQATSILAVTSLIIPYSPAYSLLGLVFMSNRYPIWLLVFLPGWFGWRPAMISGIIFCIGAIIISLFLDQRNDNDRIICSKSKLPKKE